MNQFTFQGLTWSLIPRIRNQVFLTHKLLTFILLTSHPQQPQPQVTVHDLKGDPWLDPKAEPPLEESAVDAQFRHPMQEDFIIPPTLAEAYQKQKLC